MRIRFHGSFDAVTKMGSDYATHSRFKPLHGEGKPLWEFKEHDHRLFCYRICRGSYAEVVLFGGWVKDKKGLSREEPRNIQAALSIYQEYLAELREAP